MSDLILKKPRSSWMPGIAVGWKITCKNGEKHDMMWGNITLESKDKFIENLRKEKEFENIIDETKS